MRNRDPLRVTQLLIVLVLVLLAGCKRSLASVEGTSSSLEPVDLQPGERLRVVATTSIVADVVREVAGDSVELTQLIPVGADPHSFTPTPQDMAAVSEAHVLFINGAGLEVGLEDLLAGSVGEVPVVAVSEGVALLSLSGEADGRDHTTDPHTWLDPNNVMIWVDNIWHALASLDPQHADEYEARANAYQASLQQLDQWIRDQVATIPPERRKLVTDHLIFGYFARTYGFEQVGVVTAGYSTLAEPSARDIAELEEAIKRYDVPAIFVSTSVNPQVAEQIAADTGIKVVSIYTGSLSDEHGPASTYLDYMRYDVSQIVAALRPE